MKKAAFLSAIFLAASVTVPMTAAYAADAPAQAKPAAGSQDTPNPWVDCGIGAMLFTDTHWAAVASNIVWDMGITATTSATASPNTCQSTRVQMQAALFINGTYESLAEETAAGRGEHLTALLNIYGCGAGNQPAATRQIRSAMGQAVSSAGYAAQTHDEKAAALFMIVDQTAKNQCVI